MEDVAIVGAGSTGFRPITPEVSYKEMMFEAATRAYEDANVNPRKDIDAFITCGEDYWDGHSIFDEFVPDQVGAVLKHLFTVSADGLIGMATAYMLIRTGQFDTVMVEAHSKASDILTFSDIVAFGLDPIFNRPLGGHPYYVAGLEMNRFLHETGTTKEQCAQVVVKNRKNALANAHASYGAELTVEDVLQSKPMFHPLNRLDISPLADGCIVLILASSRAARKLTDVPVWLHGVGWNSDTSWLESREWGRAIYIELAADMAYKMAGIRNPRKEIHFAEVDDLFSYKELQHLEALKLCRHGEAGRLTEEGMTQRDRELPVNVSGGALGMGYAPEVLGLQRALEAVLQLREQAGRRQLCGVETAVAQSWRGIPTATGAVAVLGREVK
ncbi:MAG: thiolase domain-containing protein [Candidatus Bathyarchaeota archaeon]|nr:MAG: thiolase domain-containing protein [Candidatus Bathyarchaeota archaeon]